MGAGPIESDDPLVGRLVKHFRIVSVLGEGGMGVVYRAVDETLGRDVALKVMRPGDARDEERRRRFLREARSAAALTHPNIATVYEIGEFEGHAFIAMELVVGATLRAHLANGVDVRQAVRIVRDIARGLSKAHAKGVVHRDLKPENVMLTGDGEVKILDFGLAKLLDGAASDPGGMGELSTVSQATAEGRVMGTPAYMSPEQAEGRTAVGPPSDVFSVGVILYELLAGVRPFRGTTGIEILYAVLHREPEPIATLRADVPAPVVAVVQRCLAKAPDERFSSGRQLLAALELQVSGGGPAESGGRIGALEKVETVSGMGTALGATLASDKLPLANAVAPPRRKGAGLAARVVGLAGAVTVALVIGRLLLARRQAPSERAAFPAPEPSAKVTKEADKATRSAPAITPYRELRASAANKRTRIAALSPDAANIALCDDEKCWVQPATGGARRSIAGSLSENGRLVSGLSYFPDGKRVLLTTALPNNAQATSFEVALDGSAPSKVGDLGDFPIISPDGTRVAIASRDRIEVATLDGRLRNRVAPCIGCSYAHWSPDGQHLVYIDHSSIDHSAQLSVVSLIDGSVHPVLTDKRLVMGGPEAIAWPSKNHIFFGSRAPEDGYVRLQDASIDDEAISVSAISEVWRSRGDSLACLTGSANRFSVILTDYIFDVYVGRLTANRRDIEASAARLSLSEAKDYAPTWQWDGSVIYLSERERDPAYFVQSLVGGEAHVIVAGPVTERPQPLVALRDGRLIYARSTQDSDAGSRAQLFVSAQAGGEHALDVPPDEKAAIQCGDGKPDRCIIMTTKGADVSFAHLDVACGRAAAPFFRGLSANADTFAVSPDARTVVALKSQRELLTVIDVATGESSSTTTSPKGELQTVSFSRDGKSLVLTGMSFGAAQYGMLRVDLNGHGDFLQRSNERYFRDASESPDGRRLAWAEGTFPAEALLLEKK